MNIYSRQEKLDLNIPKQATIIGLGGIGSWVALNMGLIGVKKLILIDYDTIEESNLNRTPFRDLDIGIRKTQAIISLLFERRDDIEFRTFNSRIEELKATELREISEGLIFDCRDNLIPLPKEARNEMTINLGYDGLSVTTIINPDYENIWDLEPEGRGYEIIPSFLAPCQFLASSVATMVTMKDFNIKDHKNEITTFNLDDVVSEMFFNEVKQ